MYFGLSEEQSFFQDNVRKYLEEHATIDNIKHIANGDKKNLSAEIHQGLLNLGINGLLIPEEFGGLGLDLLFAAVISVFLNALAVPRVRLLLFAPPLIVLNEMVEPDSLIAELAFLATVISPP